MFDRPRQSLVELLPGYLAIIGRLPV